MASKKAIIEGDTTTHGGVVIRGSHSVVLDGRHIALIGDLVECPKCGGTFPIVTGSNMVTTHGKGIALEGMKTACGAVLIGSQNRFLIDDSTSQQKDQIASASSLANEKDNEESSKDDKSVTDLYFSYGEDFIRLEDVSRHYVDLNLHLVTENYNVGETVQADVEYETENGTEKITVSGVVDANGEAIIQNIFNDEVLKI